MTIRATYRVQLHEDFTFADAERIVPYLDALGISHLYASPITTAVRGSRHGYDVVDPTRVNPELGGEAGLRSLVNSLHARGMGLILDIVPNHMGIALGQNPWWQDVLEKGEESEYARVFDIDWRAPILLPILGDGLDQVIAHEQLRLIASDAGLTLELYGETPLPVRPDDPIRQSEPSEAIAAHDPASAQGRRALAALAARQHYRLAHWRTANDELNWRRFFSINELAGVRVEDEAVFALTHALILRLYAEGLIDGLRIDHIDGLTDPAGYCRRLDAAMREADPTRTPYVVVEKILASDETLPGDWGIAGTSGYDFMTQAGGVLHDPAGIVPLRRFWQDLSGRWGDFTAEEALARPQLLAWQFSGQLASCADSFVTLAADTPSLGWVTRGMLTRAIERLVSVFPVYRTYGTGSDAPPEDGPIRAAAREAARALTPPGEAAVTDLVLDWLAGRGPGDPVRAADAVRRFQQLSAPIAAKAVEDTAFYRYGALLSLNEVGADPAHPVMSVEAFHAAMERRARVEPAALLSLATHDHKRGPDARARLAVLSAVPDLWTATCTRWLASLAGLAEEIDRGDAAMLLQTLVGAWDESAPADPESFCARIHAWQEKALREAKLRSSWVAPDEDYEARCKDLAAALLTSPELRATRDDIAAFVRRIEPAARANGLAQVALQLTAPGVSDTYQGCELLDYSLVDPDNRRAVDYERRRAALENGADVASTEKLHLIAGLLNLRRDHPALFAEGVYRPLEVEGERADHVLAFERRHGDERLVVAVAIRLGAALVAGEEARVPAQWWATTRILLPDREPLCAATAFAQSCVWFDIA
ncbi:malto-oligosyltrehalose synthase [Novosphingobium sp. PC22D]|uniref:malto-oligosyltrehalose synthase n=1 Tax=Novosphingobium sp. PC22D TaxID=1962403 RepID=UPI000BF03364|nr:malto-oligosyltrehalose synthase [Novosphingobium sp. PC22D]PEQ14571.1 malto-oligosyltrehalose synthase [Novosphingobium sp. PC22D]